ncbi:CooT family nickel-binding protein [Candidatus Bathyarchaeota archaeon]|nr:CooT family nickel-binding protein [Candidatus Bathyarchaeota archaeon]
MCEFKVFQDGEKIAEDIIYAKVEDDRVVLRDIIGTEKVIEGAEIVEVNVIGTRLILKGNSLPS